MYKFQRKRKCNKFSHAYYYLSGNKGAGPFTIGAPDFELKIFSLQINNGKGKNYLIQTQAQLDLERGLLIGSCGELNMSFCGMRVVLALFLSWVVSFKFRGWVVSDMVG